jgi:hypothetical protein
MLALIPRSVTAERTRRALARVTTLASLAASTGCASTVHRLDGDVPTAAGHPATACEREHWLVIAPTRAELYDRSANEPLTRNDGVGLYRVGESEPESLPKLVPLMGTDGSRFERHADLVRQHDQRQILAGGFGVVGALAIAAGTVLFVGAFETRRETNQLGQREEEQHIDGTEAALGGITVAAGFGLGAAGIVVTPSHAARAEADAGRYVFLPPEDPQDAIAEAVGRHNQRVRMRCARNP